MNPIHWPLLSLVILLSILLAILLGFSSLQGFKHRRLQRKNQELLTLNERLAQQLRSKGISYEVLDLRANRLQRAYWYMRSDYVRCLAQNYVVPDHNQRLWEALDAKDKDVYIARAREYIEGTYDLMGLKYGPSNSDHQRACAS